jgi:hypothetical protein
MHHVAAARNEMPGTIAVVFVPAQHTAMHATTQLLLPA